MRWKLLTIFVNCAAALGRACHFICSTKTRLWGSPLTEKERAYHEWLETRDNR